MNKARRKEIAKAIEMLEEAKGIIENCKYDEEDAYDNLPESFQDGDKGEEMQEFIDIMDEAVDNIGDVTDSLEDILG